MYKVLNFLKKNNEKKTIPELPDLILKTIISFLINEKLIKNSDKKNDTYVTHYELDYKTLLNFALVNKQFFKLVEKETEKMLYMDKIALPKFSLPFAMMFKIKDQNLIKPCEVKIVEENEKCVIS